MYTFSYPLILAFEVCAFIVFIVTMYFFKSPWRKWICFGTAFICIWYLLDMEPHSDEAHSSEWFWLKFVASFGVVIIAGIGFLDFKRTNHHGETEIVPKEPEESSVIEESQVQSVIQTSEPKEDIEKDLSVVDTPAAISPADEDDEVPYDEDQEEFVRYDVPSQSQRDFEDKVLPWFYDQISQFTLEQQESIKVCVDKFLRNGYTSGPKEPISRIGSLYTQQKIYEIVSAFMLLDKSREQCADFAKEVFSDFFWNTETKTIERKLKGKDKIQLIIDTYWEAKSIKSSRV